jgi:predicted PhzF superfamily epimerase YddE/YHI9
MLQHASNAARSMAYVFAREGDDVLARFFFLKHGAIVEDPGTGSACANLGGWLIATGAALPQHLSVSQGEAVGRPCRLGLAVGTDRSIRVSGRVVELARGAVTLPAA